MTQKELYIYKALKKKLENYMSAQRELPDPLEVAHQTNYSYKYITKKGSLRIDMDYDLFKALFEQGLWASYLENIISTFPADIQDQIPERVKKALLLYTLDSQTLSLADLLRITFPLFDEREKRG